MVEINLLPWRVYLEEHKKNQFLQYIILIWLCLLVLVLMLYSGLYIKLQTKNRVILHLQKQLSIAHKKTIQKGQNGVSSLFALIMKFQHNQVQWVNFLKRLMQLTPEGIVWLKILNQDNRMILMGNTASFQLLLEFVKLLNREQNGIHADIIKIKNDSDLLQFSLRLSGMTLPFSQLISK
jgi:Tfp pilus assembly protein PilN